MGVKSGLLITAIGLGIALYAYKKHKKQQALTSNAHSSYNAPVAAAASMAGVATSYQPASRTQLRDPNAIYHALVKGVLDKKLESFYPSNSQTLHNLASHIAATGTLEIVANEWELPDAFALDLVRLALYDIIILADDSGSMAGGTNQSELNAIVQDVADVGAAFDTSGIEVRFLNSRDQGNNVHNEQDVINLFRRNPPNGRTPIGQSLRDKILKPLVIDKARQRQLLKPVLIMILTDGEATDRGADQVPEVISSAQRELKQLTGHSSSVFISFGQVGMDEDAVRWLDSIDNDPQIGNLVDVTSAPAIETRQVMKALKDGNVKDLPPEWAHIKDNLKNDDHLWRTLFRLKRLLGGIDTWYDQSDEKGNKKRFSWSSSSEPPAYRPHWSEVSGAQQRQIQAQEQRGYVHSVPSNLNAVPFGTISTGGSNSSYYNQPPVATYNQPSPNYNQPSGNGYMPSNDGSFNNPSSINSPYGSNSNAPYPPANSYTSPYPPDNFSNGYTPSYQDQNRYPASNSNPYPQQGFNNSPYPPDNFGYPAPQGQYPPPSYQGFNGGAQTSPYSSSNQPFSGGFAFPNPSNTQY